MDPIRRNANRMLDTLTGKIPEKLTQENSFEPLPTLQEMDGASSPSIGESIKNNWLAILASLLLIMFTVFNVLAYYMQEKEEETKKMFKPFEDAYKYLHDSFVKVGKSFDKDLGEEPEPEKDLGEEPITTKNPVVATALSNQIPKITSGAPVGKPLANVVRRRRIHEEDEEEEEDPRVAINSLNMALENASRNKSDDSTYKANDTYSSVKAKAGWCFVGEERGFRNCVEVGENDKCLSGDIFPTSQVCVNPRLRA
jgi:hypothetical protein